MILPVLDYPYKTIMVKGTAGNALDKLEYLCEADPGVATTSAAWRIRKFIYDDTGFNTQILWASGDKKFEKIADNYLLYSYS